MLKTWEKENANMAKVKIVLDEKRRQANQERIIRKKIWENSKIFSVIAKIIVKTTCGNQTTTCGNQTTSGIQRTTGERSNNSTFDREIF